MTGPDRRLRRTGRRRDVAIRLPRCGTVENTALAVIVMDRDRVMIDRICSACGPAGWHGRFLQETYDPEKHGPLSELGYRRDWPEGERNGR